MEEQGSPMHVPLRLLLPGYGGGSNDYSNRRQLAVFNSPPPRPPSPPLSNNRFTLPEGWEVEEIPRADASRVDKYYYEPMTGNKFRSLREVERYINGEVYTPRRRRSKTLYRGSHSKHSSYRKMVVSGGKMLKLDEEEQDKHKMAIMPATNISFNAPYRLPEGWVVEEVPRHHGGYIDKYYYEPGTGRKFRSLSSVDKHLAERNKDTTLSETLAELREYNTPLSKAFKIGGHEKYYYKAGTGRKFRSLSSADKHLADVNEDGTISETLAEVKEYNAPLSKAFKIGSHVKSSTPWKTNIPREKVQSATFNTPPLKINWVIASPGGSSWNPFIGGSLVPESVKQQWSKRFMLSINDGTFIAPNF